MALILLFVTISLVNLGLGFGLGIYLGFGPPGIFEAWDALGARLPARGAPSPAAATAPSSAPSGS